MSSTKTTHQALGGIAVALLNFALQISGYQSPVVAFALAVIAFFLLLPWLNEQRKVASIAGKRFREAYRRNNWVRSMVLVILIGMGLGALLGGGGAALWWIKRQSPIPETAVRESPTPGLEPSPKELKLSAVTPTPIRHINTFLPREIHETLSNTGPLEVDDVEQGFVNGIVDWPLGFTSVQKVQTQPPHLIVTLYPEAQITPRIWCEVPLKGNEYLGRIKSPSTLMFRVRGVIDHLDAANIHLAEASLEQLPVAKEQLSPAPLPTSSASPADAAASLLADLVKEVKELRITVAQNPSADATARIAILKSEYEKVSKRSEELSRQDKETLDKQASTLETLTLESLEAGRTRYLEAQAAEKEQRELTSKRQKIEIEEAEKQAANTLELDEIDFAKRYTPILDHAITSLYRLLGEASKDSAVALSTDFPIDRPSIYGSNMLKDGKIVEGPQIIRVGTDKNWEFQFLNTGAPNRRQRSHWGRQLGLMIKAGNALASITSLPPLQPGPPQLRLTLYVLSEAQKPIGKPLYEHDCPLSEYQKPIEELFRKLIQNRYNVAPLPPKH